jgi:hypothetical protein
MSNSEENVAATGPNPKTITPVQSLRNLLENAEVTTLNIHIPTILSSSNGSKLSAESSGTTPSAESSFLTPRGRSDLMTSDPEGPRVSKISAPVHPVKNPQPSSLSELPQISQIESNPYSRKEIIRKWEDIEIKIKEENARINDLKDRGKNFDYQEFKKMIDEKPSSVLFRKNFIITSDQRGSWYNDLDTVNQYTEERVKNFFGIIFRVRHLEIELENFNSILQHMYEFLLVVKKAELAEKAFPFDTTEKFDGFYADLCKMPEDHLGASFLSDRRQEVVRKIKVLKGEIKEFSFEEISLVLL